MNFRQVVATSAIALLSLGLGACKGGGAEGIYKLDKTEMKKSMQVEIDKMPKDQQDLAKLGMALIDAMDMSIELKAGGEAEMKASMGGLEGKSGDAKDEAKKGEWKAEGDNVTIKVDGKETKCKLGGGKLTCDPEKQGEPSMVFVKS
jgi:hypothetical protein